MIYFEKLISFILCLVPVIYGNTLLLIENNGPAVIDGSITFHLTLENFTSSPLFYTFDDNVRSLNFTSNNATFSTTLEFSSFNYKEGCYIMTISACEGKQNHTIAKNESKFELSDSLIGKIIVHRPEEGLEDVKKVAVGENFTVAVELHDPNYFLQNAEIDYMWSIDFDIKSFTMKNFSHIYNELQTSTIVANVVANFNNNIWKSGIFYKVIQAEDPVKNINISGNPFIHHGEVLHLNVTCNGSTPFIYCAQPLELNETTENFTCHSLTGSNTCSFSIQWYFRNYGSYHYGIYISNDVRTVRKNVEVVVYNVSKQPQLSTVIIPIACTLLTLIIISGGIAYCIQQRSQIAIEVANFDFQEDAEPIASRTFFERLFDSVRCGCSGSNSYTDIFFDEEEPLISQHRPRTISI